MEEEPRFLVIPAAGLGTRMRSVDPTIPKELLPLNNKPLIHYTIEEGLYANIRDIIIIINKKKEIIRRYFEDGQFAQTMYPQANEDLDEIRRECSLTFLYQEEPKGESDAISYASDNVDENCLAIIYPDNIYSPSPGALLKLKSVFTEHNKDVIALSIVQEHYAGGFSNAGRVDVTQIRRDLYRIEYFHPRGAGRFVPRFKGELRSCGISMSGPHLFKYIERARSAVTEGEFTDLPVRQLMLKERELLGVKLPGIVFDVGNPKGYELCKNYLREHV